MELWSWHSPGFSLLEGQVDPARSPYAKSVPGVPAAYGELARRLGTNQIIWCHTLPNQHLRVPGQEWVEWAIDVPPDRILALTDGLVWNRILGIKCGLPRSWHYRWQQEARERYPNDAVKQADYEKKREDEFWGQSPPDGSWWNALFIEVQANENVVALVRHPIRPEWVVKRQLWS
jgi:hypothetical protein